MNKYELTEECKVVSLVDGKHTLYRIKALRDFADVKAGQLGGWVEKETNLSQAGNCFIYDDAVVCGRAKVKDHSCVFNDSMVFGRAQIANHAVLQDQAVVGAGVFIQGRAIIKGHSMVMGNMVISGNTIIEGEAMISSKGKITNHAIYNDEV